MSDGGSDTEQQRISDSPPEPEPDRTVQEQILRLYGSEDLLETAVGFWAKLLVEFAIVAVPVALLVIVPGFVVSYFDLYARLTFSWVVGAWVAFVTTVTGFTWCFTEATIDD
jgi:hypothetical protein